MANEKSSSGISDKLVPILLLASIGLAFVVGMLWQRVNNLQGGTNSAGGVVNTGTTGNAGNAGGTVRAPSPLSDLPALAEKSGVDLKKFESCFDEGKFKDLVEEVYQGGVEAGVTGTPANFVVNSKGEVWFVPGAFPYASMKTVIDIAKGDSSAGTLPQGVEKLDAARIADLPKITDSDHLRGESDAEIKLIEYSDYECPFCKSFHPTASQIISENDNVAWVYRHFPLDSLHPLARPAAEASECVYELGGDEAFWKFTDAAFAG